MFSGILPVRLLFFTSLQNSRRKIIKSLRKCTFWGALEQKESDCVTYKYHNPVNWHISGDSEPTKLFPRKPLLYEKENRKQKKINKIVTKITFMGSDRNPSKYFTLTEMIISFTYCSYLQILQNFIPVYKPWYFTTKIILCQIPITHTRS